MNSEDLQFIFAYKENFRFEIPIVLLYIVYKLEELLRFHNFLMA